MAEERARLLRTSVTVGDNRVAEKGCSAALHQPARLDARREKTPRRKAPFGRASEERQREAVSAWTSQELE